MPVLWDQASDDDDDDDDTGASIFSHSNIYLQVAKEKIERERRSAEKAREKESRNDIKSETIGRKTSNKRHSDGGYSRSPKRIDSGEGKKLLAKAMGEFINISDSDDDTPTPVPQPEVRRSPRNRRTNNVYSPVKPKSKMGTTMSLASDDDDDGDIDITNDFERPVAPKPAPMDEEEEDSDPELAAIKRRARERRTGQQQTSAPTASNISLGVDAGSAQLPAPPSADASVQILITSPIPGTNPLIVVRKISQNLEPIREAWIMKQGHAIPSSMAETIFFTHRGKRQYKSTLVKRLGVAVDPAGNAYLEYDPDVEGPAKVHIEAVTPELFQQQEAERARAAKAGVRAESEAIDQDDGTKASAPSSEEQVRITVKAKDKVAIKLIVYPSTPISRIVNGARKQMGFDKSQSLYLEFDGDRLDPEDIVGNTEIEDMIGLDLYVAN